MLFFDLKSKYFLFFYDDFLHLFLFFNFFFLLFSLFASIKGCFGCVWVKQFFLLPIVQYKECLELCFSGAYNKDRMLEFLGPAWRIEKWLNCLQLKN